MIRSPVSIWPLRRWLCLVLLVGLSAGCVSSEVTPTGGLPNPPFSEKGVVYLFAGLTPAGDTVARSGMYTLTQNIRASGVRAEVYNPAYWHAAADDLLAQPGASGVPVAVAGYSMGGEAATRFAERLRSAGIPVQTLLAFEAYDPAPVACNVRRVIDMYGAAGPFRMSTRLKPGKAFTGTIEQVDWSKLSPDGRHDHLGVSKEPAALRYVQNALIGDGHVRMIAPPAGEQACLGKRAANQTVASSTTP